MFNRAKKSLCDFNKICKHLRTVTLALNFTGSYTQSDCTTLLIFRPTGKDLFILQKKQNDITK